MKKGNIEIKTKKTIDSLNSKAWDLMVEDPKKGLIVAKEAYKTALEIGYKEGTASGILNQGWCHYYLADYEKALTMFRRSLEYFIKQKNREGESKTLNALGAVFHNLGKYEKSLKYYSRSLKIGRKINNLERQMAALNNIGEIFLELSEYKKAEEYFKKTLEIVEKNGLPGKSGDVLMNLGDIYRLMDKQTEALESLQKALEIGKSQKDYISMVKCLNLMGLVYSDKDYKKAEEYFKIALDISKNTGDKRGETEALINLSLYYKGRGELKEAFLYGKQAYRISKKILAPHFLYKICLHISEIYESKDKYKNALAYYKEFYRIEREVHTEETNKRLQNIALQNKIERALKKSQVISVKNRELTKSFKVLETINKIGKDIIASLDTRVITETVYEKVNTLMDASVFGIGIYEQNDKIIDYRMFIQQGAPLEPFSLSISDENSFGAYCVRNRSDLIIKDVDAEYKNYIENRTIIKGKKAKSIIYMPLLINDAVIGLITVQSYKKAAYSDPQVHILKALASYVAIALENSMNHAKLKNLKELLQKEKSELEGAYKKITHMADHDNLTGLPNRRLLVEFLNQGIEEAKRNNTILALFFLDLDNFKPINDSYGHAFGDEFLTIISSRFRGVLRSSDIVARTGGDEFIIVLKSIKANYSAEKVAEKIIAAINEPVEIDNISCSVGTSIGIALYPEDDTDIEGLIQKADRAMYWVKNQKKNAYAFYHALK